jgi:hypothetical protein
MRLNLQKRLIPKGRARLGDAGQAGRCGLRASLTNAFALVPELKPRPKARRTGAKGVRKAKPLFGVVAMPEVKTCGKVLL